MIRACPPTNGDFTPSGANSKFYTNILMCVFMYLYILICVYMYCTSSCAFTCTVHPHMPLHVLYILMCVYMYCTSSYAFTCTVHPHVRLHVLYLLICVYMNYCTSSYAFTCTVHPHVRLHVHPHMRLIIGQTGNLNVNIYFPRLLKSKY